jgi:hypothetical protein
MGGRTMKFGEFLEYVEKFDSGRLWKDVTYRNYDLLWQASTNRLRRALALCGFEHDELSVSLAECATRVCERGHCSLSLADVRQCLLEWYVWRGIERREYKSWKYRSSVAAKGTNVTAQTANK